MKVVLARSNNLELLQRIKTSLIQHWAHTKATTQQRAQWFDQSIGNNQDEVRYAALINEQNQVILVASLFKEYKFTRGLSEIYHLQIEHRACSQEQQQFFEQQVVKMLPGYKITGLGVKPGKVFKPHQIYMEMNMNKQPHLQGKL